MFPKHRRFVAFVAFFMLRLLLGLQDNPLPVLKHFPPSFSPFPYHRSNRKPKDRATVMASHETINMMFTLMESFVVACTPFLLYMVYKLDQDIKLLSTKVQKLADNMRRTGSSAPLLL